LLQKTEANTTMLEQKMNNEPVAWMNIHGQFNKKETWLFPIPLYTHQVKELTDEEIDECLYSTDWSYDPHSFARAILRKAQEK
jgi:hypothetical protein